MYTLIIVDDEPLELKIFSDILTRINAELKILGTFESAEEAIVFLADNRVDIIITDIQMSGMSGIELAKYVNENHLSTAMIFFSAHKDFEYAKSAISYNVLGYITKPINIKDITETLKKVTSSIDEKRDYDLISLKCQNDIIKFAYSTKKDALLDLKENLKANSIVFDENNSSVAILTINIHDLQNVLTNIWRYGVERLHHSIMRFLTFPRTVFVPISYTSNHINVIVCCTNMNSSDFSKELTKICKKHENSIMQAFGIDISINILSLGNDFNVIKNDIASLVAFHQYDSAGSINDTLDKSIKTAINYINCNYKRDITLTEVAETVFLTPFYFSKLFKKSTNENFTDYLNRIRLEKAKELLAKSNMKISNIGIEVGYGTKTHFYRMFRHYFGMTPLEYRNTIS